MKYKIYDWTFSPKSVGYVVVEKHEYYFQVLGNEMCSKFVSLNELVMMFENSNVNKMRFSVEIIKIIEQRNFEPIFVCESITEIIKLKENHPELFI